LILVEKRMRRLTLLAILAGSAAIGACGLALYLYQRPCILRVAVPRGSDDQEVLRAAALEFASAHEQLGLKLVLVDSLAESGHALEDQRADLAIVRSDAGMPVNGQTVLIMRRNAAVLLAPAGSALHEVEDLRGHRIGVLQTEQAGRPDGDQALLDAALAQSDIPLASVGRAPLTLAELPAAIERRDVDAVLAIGTLGSANLTEAVTAMSQAGHGPPVFIPIDEAKAIAQRSPNLESVEVLRGAFGGAQPKPAESFETLGDSTRLVARRSLGNDVVAELTELMLNAKPTLAAEHPIANRIEAPSTDKGAALPVHPGAIAYLGDEEQSFFDKYSDLIYIGAMLLSLCGTAIATVASRFKRQQNTDLERILARLLEIIAAARAASHADILDELEKEADGLLAEALAHDFNHALSGSRLAAASLGLGQVRQAISERRIALAARRTAFSPRVVGE
jgi:TRAP-type uncharacterized transport system substrate-binding protein